MRPPRKSTRETGDPTLEIARKTAPGATASAIRLPQNGVKNGPWRGVLTQKPPLAETFFSRPTGRNGCMWSGVVEPTSRNRLSPRGPDSRGRNDPDHWPRRLAGLDADPGCSAAYAAYLTKISQSVSRRSSTGTASIRRLRDRRIAAVPETWEMNPSCAQVIALRDVLSRDARNQQIERLRCRGLARHGRMLAIPGPRLFIPGDS
jgi:hypothetical protein